MARAYRKLSPHDTGTERFFDGMGKRDELNNIFPVFWRDNDLYNIPVCTEFPLLIKKFGKHHHVAAMVRGNNLLSGLFYKTGIRFKLLFYVNDINKG